MELMTVNEVAEKLKVTPLTVRRWINAGQLQGYHLGDRAGWRISEEDLRSFLESRRGGPPDEEARHEDES